MQVRPWAFGATAIFAALVVTPGGCSAGDDGGTNPGGGGAAGGTSSSGSGGFTSQTCDPACVAPQFCSVAGVCLDDGQCHDAGDCAPGAECDDQGLCTACSPPNLLLVLDRSCSMTGVVGGQSKWQIAVGAINAVTADYVGTIRFGLSLFPDTEPPECVQDTVAISIGDDNESAIQELLTASQNTSDPLFPDGPCITNIDTALEQASAEPAFDDIDRIGFVVLITDGKQYGCNEAGGDDGSTQLISDLYQQRNIATFVVGFGSGVDPTQLNVFAEAGGAATNDLSCTPEPCKYYRAEDAITLGVALNAIAKAVSCDEQVR